jgi:peptidoglycan/LPS O-acetylase OafA/YrhL
LAGWRLVVGSINPVWAYMSTDTNAYALGVGSLLAAVRHQGLHLRLPERTPQFGVGLLIALSLLPSHDLAHLYEIGIWLPLCAALVSGAIVIQATESRVSLLNGKVLGWFGAISYALYLWHAPLLQLPIAETPIGRLVAVVVAIGAAALSWALVEGPIARSSFRRRLTLKTTDPTTAPDYAS